MRYTAIIKDASPQFGGEVHIACASRRDAIIRARQECLNGRAIGIECYGRVLPKNNKVRIIKEFKKVGLL
jgi:hypothetical protein